MAGFPVNFVGFTMATDADLEIRVLAAAGSDSGDLDTGVDVVANTNIVLAFEWDGTSKVNFFADGVKVYTYSTLANIPTGIHLTPTMGVDNASAAAVTMDWDYILVMNDRD
jgi:hypothetical protein